MGGPPRRGLGNITDVSLSEHVFARWSHTNESFRALRPPPTTWIQLVLHEVLGSEQDLVEQYLEEAMVFHSKVTEKAAAHLALLGENTMRTPWLAAKLLLRDRLAAQDAAKALAKHLASTQTRTAFEDHLFTNEELLQNLEAFATAQPPTHLWR